MVITLLICLFLILATFAACNMVVKHHLPVWYYDYILQRDQISALVDQNNELMQENLVGKHSPEYERLCLKYIDLHEICGEKDKYIKSLERKLVTHD